MIIVQIVVRWLSIVKLVRITWLRSAVVDGSIGAGSKQAVVETATSAVAHGRTIVQSAVLEQSVRAALVHRARRRLTAIQVRSLRVACARIRVHAQVGDLQVLGHAVAAVVVELRFGRGHRAVRAILAQFVYETVCGVRNALGGQRGVVVLVADGDRESAEVRSHHVDHVIRFASNLQLIALASNGSFVWRFSCKGEGRDG